MSTFRQLFVVAVISFGIAVATVSQLPYFNAGSTLSMLWNFATSSVMLPLTVGGILIVTLLLWWNPEQQPSR